MAHDVFISYSSKDKTTGDAVCAMLESEGIRCWIAPRDVTPSMEWSECIIDAIQECRIMVLVFTTSSNESPQIHREIERAVNHGVAVLPFRTEDILPDKALEYFIGDVHWLDALTVPLEAHLKNLADTVKMLLAKMPPLDTPGGVAANQPAPPAAGSTFAARAEVQASDPNFNRAAADFSRAEFAKQATLNPIRTEMPQQRAPVAPPYVPAPAAAQTGMSPARMKLLSGVLVGALVIILAAYFVLRSSGSSKPQVGGVPANNAGGTTPQQTAATPSAPGQPTTGGGATNWTTQPREAVEAAANSGVLDAEFELGDRYFSGRDGGSRDYDIAMRWFREAAEHGLIKAQNQMGDMYTSGRGAPQDYAKAMEWYRKAADQGSAEAQTDIGVMYDNGQGVTQNHVEANVWYRKAAEQGFSPGEYDLALSYDEGSGLPQNYAEASKWYRKAAEQDNVSAMTNLGFLYENGEGLPQDYAQAIGWYRKAAEHGNALAEFNIGEIYEKGYGVPRDIREARNWYQKAADQGYANAVKKLAALQGQK
jgi:TPR repeat protein